MHCDSFLRSESEGSKRTPPGPAIDLSCSVVRSCYQLHATGAGSDDNDHQISAMDIAVGDRVAIASEVAKEGVCDREQSDRADKIGETGRRCWALLSTRLNNQTNY